MSTASPPELRESFPLPLPPEPQGEEPAGILSLDLRSLAFFRMAFGLVVLCDLVSVVPQIDDFYTDNGIMPRAVLLEKFSNPWDMSIHLMSGDWAVQLVLLLITIAAVCGVIVGYRTRLSTFVSWAMIASMQTRNQFILHGGDDVIRLLLFWSMFAPLNARASLDRVLNPRAPPFDNANYSWGTQALMLQLCFVYWFTAAWKWHPVWTTEGSALYYALSLDYFVKPFGRFLLHYPDVMRWMTHGTLALELLGPFLLFVPAWNARIRLFVALSFILFHTGIGLSMALGTFPWVCSAAWLMFLPAFVWDRLDEWTARWRRRLAPLGESVVEKLRASLAPSPAPRDRLGPVGGAVVLACVLIVFAGNIGALPWMGIHLSKPASRIASIASLGQRWALFAPYPTIGDGWYQIVGVHPDGSEVDAWNGGAPTTSKPVDVMSTYRDAKWRKYLSNLPYDDYRDHRPVFGAYLCRHWNDRHGGRGGIREVYVNYFRETTPPPGQPITRPTRVELSHQRCSQASE